MNTKMQEDLPVLANVLNLENEWNKKIMVIIIKNRSFLPSLWQF